MRWQDVRFTEELARHQQSDGSYEERTEFVGIWHKPTTKNGLAHTIPIPPVLAARLHQIPRTSEWIFTGCAFHPMRRKSGPASYSMIHKHWIKVRDRAGLPDVRPYDLRRTCASWLAINGENAVLIAKVLNHTNLQCTGIYTRLNTAPVSRALNAHEDQVIGCAKKHVIHPEPFRDAAPHDAGIVDLAEARTNRTDPEGMEWPG
jgi:integrase